MAVIKDVYQQMAELFLTLNMALLQILPKIFYADIEVGIKFFVEKLGFQIGYNDDVLYIVNRDQITFQLLKVEADNEGDRPEIRIATDNIEAIYSEIKQRAPEILHPNLSYIKHQPWGLREFAVLDPTTVCLVFQQPQ